MPELNPDLHGMAPDDSPVALLLLDVINDLEWDEGNLLLEHFLPMSRRLAALKRRARQAGIPAIYINDNYGRWRSDWHGLIEHCLDDRTRGRDIVHLLRPEEEDYFVLKPKHSGFFSTSLEVLLSYLHVHTLIITGVAGNICVLFTANDAYMRDFRIVVPGDCVASNDADENAHALRQIETVLKADTSPSEALDLEALKREPRRPASRPREEVHVRTGS